MKQKVTKAIKRDRNFIMIFPLLVAVMSYILIRYACNRYSFVINECDGLNNLSTMLSIWGTLLGFLVTAVSILLVMSDGKFLLMLKATGHYGTILWTYIICCIHLFIAVIVAVFCILTKYWSMTIFALICSFTIDTMLLVAFCLYFLFALIIRVNE